MSPTKKQAPKNGKEDRGSNKKPQLASRTFWLLILTGLLPSLVAAFVNLQTQQALLAKRSRNLQVSAEQLAKSFAVRLESAANELRPVAGRKAFSGAHSTAQERLAELSRTKQNSEVFEDFFVVDSRGTILVTTGPDSELTAEQKWIGQVQRGESTYFGPVKLEEEGPEGLLVAVPLASKRESEAHLLVGFAKLSTLTVDIDPFALGQSGFAVLASTDGTILAGNSPSLIGRTIPKSAGEGGDENVGKMVGVAGEYFTATRTMKMPGLSSENPWQVMVAQSRAEVLQSTRQSATWSLLTVVLITPEVLVLGLFFSSSMRKSLGALIEAARDVAQGNLKPLPANMSYREIGELAEAFDQMTASLAKSHEEVKRYQEHLENLVEERTSQLQEKSEQLAGSNKELQLQAKHLEQARQEAVRAHEELKSAQTEIVQMEKMSSLGQLVAGIAHEMNTPIGAIYNCLDQMHHRLGELPGYLGMIRATNDEELENLSHLARRVLDAPTGAGALLGQSKRNDLINKVKEMGLKQNARQVADMLGRFGLTEPADMEAVGKLAERYDMLSLIRSFGEICQSSKITKQSAEKVANIIQALRYYSHSDKDSVDAVDLKESLSNTLVIMLHKVKTLATVETEIADDLPLVYANGELSQVWTNLINNALDAIQEKGLDAESGHLKISAETAEDGQVAVTIGGNGKSIPTEVQSRVFDPFFTTKGVGRGTGLGLSVVTGIVQRHQGKVSFSSNEDWTSFTVTLPVGEAHERINTDNEILCDVRG